MVSSWKVLRGSISHVAPDSCQWNLIKHAWHWLNKGNSGVFFCIATTKCFMEPEEGWCPLTNEALLCFIVEACLSYLGLLLKILWSRWEKQRLMWPPHTWLLWGHCSFWLAATSLMESQYWWNVVCDVRNAIEVSISHSGSTRMKWPPQPQGMSSCSEEDYWPLFYSMN